MKKRNFVAILMVAIGLFASVSLFATDYTGSNDDGSGVGGSRGGDVTGVYVPD